VLGMLFSAIKEFIYPWIPLEVTQTIQFLHSTVVASSSNAGEISLSYQE
jgi:hypothetical protein